jgi:PAS domain S-box-containing protein
LIWVKRESAFFRRNYETVLEKQILLNTLMGIINSTNDLIYSLDINYLYTSFNNNHAVYMKKIYGSDIEIGNCIMDYISIPEDRIKLKNNIDDTLRGYSITREFFYDDALLSHSYFEVSYNPVKDSDENIIGAAIFGKDITKRKKGEEVQKESERRLREAQEMAHLGYWYWNVKTGNVEWSDEVYKIFRLNPKEFSPQIDSILALSPWPEDHERGNDLINRAIKTHDQGTYEQKFLRPDNSIGYYTSTFQGNYNSKGDLISIVGSVMDITDRKNAELQSESALKAAQISEKKYRKLHETLMDGFVYVNMNGSIIESNEFYQQMVGYNPEELTCLNYNDLTPEKWYAFEKRIVEEQILPRGYSDVYEKEYMSKCGKIIPVELKTFLIKDDEGNNEGMWAIVRDITERKRAEEALLERDKQLIYEKKKLQTLLDISSGLYSVNSFQEIGKTVSDILEKYRTGEAIGIKLGVYDFEEDIYQVVYITTDSESEFSKTFEHSLKPCALKDIMYYSKIAIKEKKTLLIPDNHSEYSLNVSIQQKDLARSSMVFIPLYNKDVLIGLLSFARSPENSIDRYFMDFLDSISKYVSMAINVHLN